MLKQRSDEQLAHWDELVKTDIATFNQLVRQQDVPAIILDQDKDNSAAPAAGVSSGGNEKTSAKK